MHHGRVVGRLAAELGAGVAADGVVEPTGQLTGGRKGVQELSVDSCDVVSLGQKFLPIEARVPETYRRRVDSKENRYLECLPAVFASNVEHDFL